MPSQIVTTFGLYATAPTQIVLLIVPRDVLPEMFRKALLALATRLALEERHSQKQLGDELAQYVARWGHDGARVRIAEQAFDAHMLGERRTPANAHCCRGDGDGDIACRRFCFKHAQHGCLAGLLKMLNQIVDARREAVGINLHGRELRAQCRQALAEALAEMLEFRAFEVRRSSSDRGST